jgi:restriction system protein
MMADELPTYGDLMYPVLKAVQALGGSGTSREITAAAVEAEGFSDELLAVTYEGRDKSIVLDRLDWARSYCKLGGVLESPRRGLFLITTRGQEIAALQEVQARGSLQELDREVRRNRTRKLAPDANVADVADESPDDNDEEWRDVLLARLHRLSPDAFEHFVLFVLRSQGMELRRVGGSGDEGIDGIGTAPISSVLSTTVAVQAKCYEPSRTVGRETVALFQSDATAVGAEHGVLVTTGRFSEPARRAALGRHPTIDLIDGDKLVELCHQENIGIVTTPTVNQDYFDRFEDA